MAESVKYRFGRGFHLALNPLKRVWALIRGYREVRLIGFLGDRSLDSRLGLLREGHFGISLDGGKTIYGFHPSLDGMKSLGSGQAVGDFLRNGGEIPGAVFNDTQLFVDAYAFSKYGKQTTVWQRTQYITPEHFERIRTSLGAYLPEGVYRFPPYDTLTKTSFPMPPDCNNCATWPRTRGLWIADDIGHLRGGYMERFLRAGARRWKPHNL